MSSELKVITNEPATNRRGRFGVSLGEDTSALEREIGELARVPCGLTPAEIKTVEEGGR